MYVCICNNVTERQVQQAIADGARSVRDLNRELCVGGQCGKCTCVARKLLQEARAISVDAVAVA